MSFNVSHLPAPIARRLRRFYARKRLLALLRIVFAVVIVYGVALFLATHVDRFVFLSTAARFAMLVGVHLIAGALAVAGLAHWSIRRPSTREIAYELESALGKTAEERIVTLESVMPRAQAVAESAAIPGASATDLPTHVGQRLLEQLKSAAVDYSENQQTAGLVHDPWFQRLGIGAANVLAVALLLAIPSSYQWPLMIARFYQPANASLARPSFLEIKPTPDKRQVIGRGGELVISARLVDKTPALIAPVMDLLGASAGRMRLTLSGPEVDDLPEEERDLYMSRVQQDLYLFTRSDLRDDLSFRIRTGNAQAGPIDVDVVVQPSITDLEVDLTPPDYTGLPARPVENPFEPINVLEESKLTLRFSSDQKVVAARLEPVEGGEPIELAWDAQTNSTEHVIEPDQAISYRLIVLSEHGFENVDRPTISIGVSEDLPPTITLQYPPAEFTAVGPQIVPIEAAIQDNLGVETVSIAYTVNPSPIEEQTPTRVPIDLGEEAGNAEIDLSTQIDLADTNAVPGDSVLVQLRSRDAAGGESSSRPVLIRIVPFSRGEHERQRLVALRAVVDAVNKLVEPAEEGQAPPDLSFAGRIGEARWLAVKDIIRGANAPMPDDPKLDSLFDLLTFEHDLTENYVDRRDVRKLIGALQVAASTELRAADRDAAQTIERLTTSVAPRLRRYRVARNLSARLFGLRNEANRLRAELQARPDGGSPNLASINRRAKLYLEAMQDAGADLLNLARASEVLDLDTLGPQVTDMNSSAFDLTMRSLAARRRAVDQLQQNLVTVIHSVRDALPRLYADSLEARRELDAAHAAGVANVLENAPADPSDAWREAARRWLSTTRLLADHDPFTPIGLRTAPVAMLDAMSKQKAAGSALTEDAAWKAGARLLLDDEPTADEATLTALAFQWRLMRLADADLPADEVDFSIAIMRMEAAAEAPSPDGDAWRARAEALRAMTVGTTPSTDAAATIDRSMMPLPAGARAAVREAGSRLRDDFPEVEVTGQIDQMIEANTVAQAAIDALNAALQSADADVATAAKEANAALERSAAASRSAQSLLAARLGLVPGEGRNAERIDALRQEWSEAYARFTGRTLPGREALRSVATGEGTAEQLGRLSGDLNRVKFLHEVWVKQVEELKARWLGAEEAEPLETSDPLLNRTRALASLALVQEADEAGRARAMDALQQFEAAAGMWLNSWADEADRAVAAIDRVRAALQADKVDPAAVREDAELAAGELGRIVEALGAAEKNASIARALTELTPAQRLAANLAAMPMNTDAAVSRARYAAADLADDLAVLADDLAQSGSRVEQDDYFQFAYRPWAKLYDNDVRHREEQLDDLAAESQRQALLSTLVTLADNPRQHDVESGYPWIASAYRLARSGLYQPGGRRPPPPPRDPRGANYIEFLLQELQDSRQQPDVPYWGERIDPYLDVVEDVIRFYE